MQRQCETITLVGSVNLWRFSSTRGGGFQELLSEHPDQNYQFFYMLCAAPPEDIARYKLGNPRTFHYLNQSQCFELDGVDDSEEYLATRRALDIVGISSDEQDAIFRVLAAILHLGNMEFVKGKEMDSSEPKDDKSKLYLRTVAELFM